LSMQREDLCEEAEVVVSPFATICRLLLPLPTSLLDVGR
jgi:hypothetical protein